MKKYIKFYIVAVSILFFCFGPKTLIKDSFRFKAITSTIWQSVSASNADTLVMIANQPKWLMKFNTDFTYNAILNDSIKTNGRWAFNAKLNKIQLINTICVKKTFDITRLSMQEFVYSS
ncbi:MAG: hypothetical protein EAZ53_10335 [Bacteroidetes bacterium]|nr:MAG: hypothetical protein EAZ53_10335 [Bacteroidota bacterium]